MIAFAGPNRNRAFRSPFNWNRANGQMGKWAISCMADRRRPWASTSTNTMNTTNAKWFDILRARNGCTVCRSLFYVCFSSLWRESHRGLPQEQFNDMAVLFLGYFCWFFFLHFKLSSDYNCTVSVCVCVCMWVFVNCFSAAAIQKHDQQKSRANRMYG